MFDFTWFRAINGLAEKSAVLDVLGIFFAVHLIVFILGGTAVLSFLRKRMSIFILAASSAALAYCISQIIGEINFRPRPFVMLDGVRQLVSKSALSKSFPSDHASLAFALASSTYFAGERKWGTILLILAALVALGRVFVGVHFPLDVIAGALLGSFSAFVVYKLVKSLKLKIKN